MKALREADFPSVADILADVRALVADACRTAGCCSDCRDQIVLAVNEACMNVIQHGYRHAADRTFRIAIFADGGELIVQLLDNGRPAADSDLQPREFDELRPGGLGVRIMREVMDSVAYRPPPAGFTNLLEMTKTIY